MSAGAAMAQMDNDSGKARAGMVPSVGGTYQRTTPQADTTRNLDTGVVPGSNNGAGAGEGSGGGAGAGGGNGGSRK